MKYLVDQRNANNNSTSRAVHMIVVIRRCTYFWKFEHITGVFPLTTLVLFTSVLRYTKTILLNFKTNVCFNQYNLLCRILRWKFKYAFYHSDSFLPLISKTIASIIEIYTSAFSLNSKSLMFSTFLS